MNQFAVAEGSLLSYFSLFLAILGVGGTYASLFVLIADSVPTSQVGGVIVIACTIAVLSTTGAPIIVLLPAPIPYFFLASMITISITVSCCLNKAKGRNQNTDESLVNNWGGAHGDSEHKGASLFHDSIDRHDHDRSYAFYGAREGYAAILSTSFMLEKSRVENSTHRDNHQQMLNTSHSLVANKYQAFD